MHSCNPFHRNNPILWSDSNQKYSYQGDKYESTYSSCGPSGPTGTCGPIGIEGPTKLYGCPNIHKYSSHKKKVRKPRPYKFGNSSDDSSDDSSCDEFYSANGHISPGREDWHIKSRSYKYFPTNRFSQNNPSTPKKTDKEIIIEKLKDKQDEKEENDELVCSICSENKKKVAYTSCGHVPTCIECTRQLIKDELQCPICRTVTNDVLIIFH
jgi:hypothetical protein